MAGPEAGRGGPLWGLCYRITGVAADADEILQETELRALARPPAAGPLGPWKTQVAANLARDRLRRRKREGYVGTWLPSPVELEAAPASADLERLETLSTAYLVALEALTPTQRTVLVMRDVLELPAAEVAQALGLREDNVRMVHRRARLALEAWRREQPRLDAGQQARVGEVLQRFVTALATGDEAAVRALLADDAVELVDGAGRYHSARLPVVGAARIARFNLRLLRIRGAPSATRLRTVNGLPALELDFEARRTTDVPRNLVALWLDRAGRIARVFSYVAPAKLASLKPGDVA